jgi:hypothetical protein
MRWRGDDFAFTAGHHLRALPEARRFQISLRSRCNAAAALGFTSTAALRNDIKEYCGE